VASLLSRDSSPQREHPEYQGAIPDLQGNGRRRIASQLKHVTQHENGIAGSPNGGPVSRSCAPQGGDQQDGKEGQSPTHPLSVSIQKGRHTAPLLLCYLRERANAAQLSTVILLAHTRMGRLADPFSSLNPTRTGRD